MKKELTPVSEKAKRYTVLADKVEVLKTSNQHTALDKVAALQKTNTKEIILSDDQKKSAVYYTKTIHQQNYRIEGGDFQKEVPIVATLPASI
jgi:gamma-glutamylcyclotransferase (GGCT)/AIG2-like uncharacterized protein YtfP